VYDKSQLNESCELAQIDDGQLVFFFAGFFHRLVPYQRDISSVLLQ